MQWKKDGGNFVTLYKYDTYYRLSGVYYNYVGSLVNIVYPQTADVTYSYLNGTNMKATANGTSLHNDHHVITSYNDRNDDITSNRLPSLPPSNATTSILRNIPITLRQPLISNLQHLTSRPAWDAAGNRITFQSSTRVNEADTYTFVYDPTAGIPAVIEETTPTGTNRYIREPGGELVARVATVGTTETTLYYHFDELGSTQFLTGSDGVITDKYTYDAWGNLTSHTGNTQQPYQYVGKYGYYTHTQDPNIKMMQLGVRLYDAETGRFIQRDPLRFSGGINSYVYVGMNPNLRIDPLGLKWWDGWANGNWGESIPILGDWMYDFGYAMGEVDSGAHWSTAICPGLKVSAGLIVAGFGGLWIGEYLYGWGAYLIGRGIPVTHWDTGIIEALQPGMWVEIGYRNPLTYFLTLAFLRGYPYSSGVTTCTSRCNLVWQTMESFLGQFRLK